MQKSFMRKLSKYLFLFLLVSGTVSNIIATSSKGSEVSPSKDAKPANIAIIIGSTRPHRIGKQIGEWILKEVSTIPGVEFKVVDLADFSLPLLNEPVPAAQSDDYVHDHTKKWSTEVKSYQGYIFVIPEYNGGYPASIKNAVDYLFKEWDGKAALIISYGFHGGERSAGQFKQVLTNLKLRLTQTTPALTLKREMFDEEGQIKNVEQDFVSYVHVLRQAVAELIVLASG